MSRNDSFDSFDSFGSFDSFEIGLGSRPGGLIQGLLRSREGHLGVALPASTKNRTPLAPAPFRNWNLGENGLPQSTPSLLTRVSPTVRAQLFQRQLLEGLSFREEVGDASGTVILRLGEQPLFALGRPAWPTWQAQCGRVESWAALRSERASEIVSQLGPQLQYWSSVVVLNPSYSPYTLELIHAAMNFTSVVLQEYKFRLPVPRPADISPRIQPMIEAPAFFAYPSGHATQAFMVARLLFRLIQAAQYPKSKAPIKELEVQLFRQAERIATNRVVAGVHYPLDSTAGCALGIRMAEFVLHRCTGTSGASPEGLTAPLLDTLGDADFEPGLAGDPGPAGGYVWHPIKIRPEANKPITLTGASAFAGTPMAWLFGLACEEWRSAGHG